MPGLSRKNLIALTIPVVLLLGGAGVGLVVASERPYAAPSGEKAFRSAPASIAGSGPALKSDRTARNSAKKQAAALKKKCRKKRGAAKKRCLKKVRQLLAKPKYMPVKTAERKAEDEASRIWENDIGGYVWTDYGSTGECRRLARNSVSCAVYVFYEEEDYSSEDYGSVYTCEWAVNARYDTRRKLVTRSGFANRECYWD